MKKKIHLGSMRLAASALLSAMVLNACAPAVIVNATIEQDKFAKAFVAPDDKALIYVYLDEPNLNISKHLVIDGRIAGIIRPTFYLMSRVTPGHHRVGLGHTEADSISLDTEQGKAYFIDAHATCDDGRSRAQLQLVDESTGKQRVLASNLANVTLLGSPLLNHKPTNPCKPPAGNA